MARHFFVFVAALGLALRARGIVARGERDVRVEGKTQPIFGSVPVKVDAQNALAALDAAGRSGSSTSS